MNIKVTLNLEELKKRLCPECKEAMDSYLKELAAEALSKQAKDSSKQSQK